MSTDEQPACFKMLGNLLSPYTPLYMRKLTTTKQLKEAADALAQMVDISPNRSVYMLVSLYDGHPDLYNEYFAEQLSKSPLAGSKILLEAEMTKMRDALEALVDCAMYNDYLITHWSATGNIEDLVKLAKRTTSSIEEVSVTATWAINVISSESKIFADAIEQAKNIN